MSGREFKHPKLVRWAVNWDKASGKQLTKKLQRKQNWKRGRGGVGHLCHYAYVSKLKSVYKKSPEAAHIQTVASIAP